MRQLDYCFYCGEDLHAGECPDAPPEVWESNGRHTSAASTIAAGEDFNPGNSWGISSLLAEARDAGLSMPHPIERASCAKHGREDWCHSQGKPHANVATASRWPAKPEPSQLGAHGDKAANDFLRSRGFNKGGEPL